jgi:hypothetical protein
MDFVDLHINKVKTSEAKIFTVTTDTTSNMNKSGGKLEEMGVCHVHCTDLVLQLTCKFLYEKKEDLDEGLGPDFACSVTKVRALVSFFNQSTQALEKLKRAQFSVKPGCNPLGMITDVDTHWWSTHDMVQRLIELKTSVNLLHVQNQLGKCVSLTLTDWANLKNLLKILKPFKDAQKFLEGEKYVTANFVAQAVITIRTKLKAIADDHTSVAANAANSLLQNFQEHWRASDLSMFWDTVQRGARDRQIGVHPALLISTFLDPHCKSLFSVPDEASKADIKSRVLQLMKSSETTHCASLAPAAAAAPSEEKEESEDKDDMFAAMEAAAAAASYGGNNASPGVLSVDNACSDELNRYMAAPILSIRAKVDGGCLA